MSLRPDGNTGVHTHVRQLELFMDRIGQPHELLTPFSWGGLARYPAFGARRLVLDPLSEPAGIVWYRHTHEWFLRKALQRRLTELEECVVYAQDPLAASAALKARRGPHQRVVSAVHFRTSQADECADGGGIARDGRVFEAIRRFEGQVLPHVDGLVYVSRWGREALLDWLPEASTVPSTVVANFAQPLQAAAESQLAGDLVTTGRLEPAKNQAFLLQVLAESRRAGHRLTLDMFGDGPSRETLLNQSRELGVEDQVRFRGFRPDVRALLPQFRVYVHASYSESLPLSLIEAMAAGLPVLAGDVGGISELCDDGVEARFWPLDDPGKAAQILVQLLGNEAERSKAGDAARSRFLRDFDTDVVAPRLLEFLCSSTEP